MKQRNFSSKVSTLVLLTFSLLSLAVAPSFSQGRFSIGPEVAMPVGDWSDVVGLGIGGTVRYEGAINDNLNWMATAGYLSFGDKEDLGVKFSMIPINAGVKYYFDESFSGFYAGAELGFNVVKAKYEDTGFGSFSASETKFGFAPMVGYHISVIDIGAKYALVSDANYFGVRVAYVFGGQ